MMGKLLADNFAGIFISVEKEVELSLSLGSSTVRNIFRRGAEGAEISLAGRHCP